jgi:putative hydrolase of the HAD superfamily
MSASRSSVALVIFDMDGVLCVYDRQARAAHLAGLAGISAAEVYDAIWTSGFDSQGDAGTLDAADYLREFGARIGYPITLDQWLAGRLLSMAPRRDVLDLVGQVRARVPVAVLTNNSTLIPDHIGRIFPELPPLFGRSIFASAGFRAAKPDPECFRRCVAALGVAPSSALFIDDQPENVAGAQRAGLAAHRYTSTEALADWLRNHGLLPA